MNVSDCGVIEYVDVVVSDMDRCEYHKFVGGGITYMYEETDHI